MGLTICKIRSKCLSPWFTCHHALKSTITKLSAMKKIPSLCPYYLHFGSVYLFTPEWTGLIIITYCFMKMKTFVQRKRLAVPDKQPKPPGPKQTEGEGILISKDEPRKMEDIVLPNNRPKQTEGEDILISKDEPRKMEEIVLPNNRIKQVIITSSAFKKPLAARRRAKAKTKGNYEIKPTDSQGDQVDAVAAAAFEMFEDNKTAVALLFRSGNEWVQLCYKQNKLLIESLTEQSDYKKDHLFILLHLEQNRYKFQCAFHQEYYVIVKPKGDGHCVSLGNDEDQSIFELITEDGKELISNA